MCVKRSDPVEQKLRDRWSESESERKETSVIQHIIIKAFPTCSFDPLVSVHFHSQDRLCVAVYYVNVKRV